MTLTAPYNFVPIADRVCAATDPGIPEGLPSQDDPATGGLCGELHITLTAKTPILVAGAQDGREKKFFETPDGKAIQGSTIRGMIRNVIEIASFAKMWRVENRRFGMRDLTNGARLDYGSRMSEDHGNKTYEARALGGWLTETSEGLFLEEVAYGRIKHSDLFGVRRPNKKTAMELEDQYKGPNPRSVWIENQPGTHPHGDGKSLVYRKAYLTSEKPGLSPTDARVVFTGMPSDRKHMEFAFPQPTGSRLIQVPGEVWEKFLDVHENLEKPSPTWVDRRAKLRNGQSVPVFFLLKNGATETSAESLDQIGLSMMFKMAGENSTHKMMPQAHLDEENIDLPTRMFGRINKGHGSFRGRLSFGIMQQACNTGLEFPEGEWLVLSSPKPSYFPSYVRQRDLSDATHLQNTAQYRSYMNWKHADGSAAARDTIRGWKRYPHPSQLPQPARSNPGVDSSSHLFPLKEGATFTGKIRFHNLHKIELSALLWALQWGGAKDCFHSVGMGKPFGWGRSQISVDKLLVDYQPREPSEFATDFKGAMTNMISGWDDTPQMKSLLGMARPEHDLNVVGQMVLRGFRDAKVAREALPDIGFGPQELGITIPAVSAKIKGASPVQPAQPAGFFVGQNVKVVSEACDGVIKAISGDKADVLLDDGSLFEDVPFSDLG